MNPFVVNNRKIGDDASTYIIAEMSANHNQDLDEAKKIIHAAKKAGADAVKLQTYTPDTLTINSDSEWFQIGKGSLWENKTLYELYQEAYMPWDWHEELFALARSLNLDIFSTAFDESALTYLETLNVMMHKIASFEIVDIPLIQKMAKLRKPLLISTGLSSLDDICEAINTVRSVNPTCPIALLKCTSAYPAPYKEMNLNAIPFLKNYFQLPVGLSDHSRGIEVPIAAVTLGACIIEKHFTLDRSNTSPDSDFSLEPESFRQMVNSIRNVEDSLGKETYHNNPEESKSNIFRKSLFVVKNMKKDEIFTKENLRCIRPGFGLHPKYYFEILGKKAKKAIDRGTPMNLEYVF
jgi:pseudaminic acid synthase